MNRKLLVYLALLFSNSLVFSQSDCDCWKKEFTEQNLDYSTSVKEMEKAK